MPLAGLPPTFGFPGDLIVVLYLLSLPNTGYRPGRGQQPGPIPTDRRHTYIDPGILLRSALPAGAAGAGDGGGQLADRKDHGSRPAIG